MTTKTTTAKKALNDNPAAKFRAELQALMPGYKWTVHKNKYDTPRLEATGIQTSGFNRLSTVKVERTVRSTPKGESPSYLVTSAGFGAKAPWEETAVDGTLARAMRALQDIYKNKAQKYKSLEIDLESGRRSTTEASAD